MEVGNMRSTVFIVVNDGLISEVYSNNETTRVVIVDYARADRNKRGEKEVNEQIAEIEKLVDIGAIHRQY
jgi:hypothetical protein